MTVSDLREACQVMQEFGVTQLTLGDVVIVRENKPVEQKREVIDEKDVDIKHRIEEVKSVMQLGDEELLNRMFPEETEEQSSVN